MPNLPTLCITGKLECANIAQAEHFDKTFIAGSLEAAYSLNWGAREI